MQTYMHIQTDRQRDRQARWGPGRGPGPRPQPSQPGRQTDRQADKQTDKQTVHTLQYITLHSIPFHCAALHYTHGVHLPWGIFLECAQPLVTSPALAQIWVGGCGPCRFNTVRLEIGEAVAASVGNDFGAPIIDVLDVLGLLIGCGCWPVHRLRGTLWLLRVQVGLHGYEVLPTGHLSSMGISAHAFRNFNAPIAAAGIGFLQGLSRRHLFVCSSNQPFPRQLAETSRILSPTLTRALTVMQGLCII